jgi:uncharacterized protein YegP (UPF0339 family)
MRIEFIFVIKKSKAKEPYHWVCKASNGEIRCTSENYTQKASARQAVTKFMAKMKPGSYSYEDDTGEMFRPKRKRNEHPKKEKK